MEYLRKVKSGEVKFSRSFEGLFLSLLLSLLRAFLLSFVNLKMIFAETLLTCALAHSPIGPGTVSVMVREMLEHYKWQVFVLWVVAN